MKRTLDILSILGIVLALLMMVIGIVLNKGTDENGNTEYTIIMENFSSFWDPTSLVIVVGGTFSCLFVMFPLSDIAKVPKHLGIVFLPRKYDPVVYIDKIVELAKTARINGLLSLEEQAAAISDPFLKNSIQMIVDSVDPEKVKSQMELWIDETDNRHFAAKQIYGQGAALGPAFGMIGTLIGLINMLKSLQDIESVGPNMAVALITTLYGSMLANIFFMPFANKLGVRNDEEMMCKRIILEGVQSIQAGENPNSIQEKLVQMLPDFQQKKLAKKAGAGAAAAPAESEAAANG